MTYSIRVAFIITSISIAACVSAGDLASDSEQTSISPEVREMIAEVQSDYMLCMVPKLPEFDDSVNDVATVAAELRESCASEAKSGAQKLRTVDASPEFRDVLVAEYQASLEGHSTKLVNRWRKRIQHPDSWTTADMRANN